MELRNLIRKIIVVAVIFGCISACTKEVEIDIPGYEEQLVVDGSIETNQPPIVLLSTSNDIYSPTDLDAFMEGFVSGAEVTMSDGTNTFTLNEICTDNLPPGSEDMLAEFFGISPEELANFHLCAYTTFNAAAFGQVGSSYELTVKVDGNTYTGSTTIMPPTTLDALFWEEESSVSDHGFSHAILTDPVAGYDAYQWEVRRINQDAEGNPIDAGFTKTFNPVFDDEFVNGQTFEFFYENPMTFGDENVPENEQGYYKRGDTVVVKFSKLDDEVYEFLISKYTQLGTNGNPFASPTNIVSNLDGGCLGVWAGYSPTFDTLVCEE